MPRRWEAKRCNDGGQSPAEATSPNSNLSFPGATLPLRHPPTVKEMRPVADSTSDDPWNAWSCAAKPDDPVPEYRNTAGFVQLPDAPPLASGFGAGVFIPLPVNIDKQINLIPGDPLQLYQICSRWSWVHNEATNETGWVPNTCIELKHAVG